MLTFAAHNYAQCSVHVHVCTQVLVRVNPNLDMYLPCVSAGTKMERTIMKARKG